MSYLDIIVLSSVTPCLFVAKRDVARWPLFGWLACAGGTIFVDRQRKLATRGAIDSMNEAVRSGVVLVVFPEGTSSGGGSVLPFKSALLQPVIDLGCRITAAAIDYSLKDGSVADEVCYWRDMTLVPHLLNLFRKPTVEAVLVIKLFTCGAADRKELAHSLRREINAMRS